MRPKLPNDLSDLKLHELFVIRKLKKSPFHKSSAWLCHCDCGRYTIKPRNAMIQGHVKSCGCRKERARKTLNGLSRTSEYRAWQGMKARCSEKTLKCYYRYGGRGIVVCERWLDSLENFIADVGKRPSPKHSIERIDNDGNYEPDNVCWATKETQQNNTRRNIKALYNGEMLSIAQIARRSGCKENRIRWWLRKGLTPEDAVSKALDSIKK